MGGRAQNLEEPIQICNQEYSDGCDKWCHWFQLLRIELLAKPAGLPVSTIPLLSWVHLKGQFWQACAGPYTQPVGLGRPATLQAPLAGPEGNNS